MKAKNLLTQQLASKCRAFEAASLVDAPPSGWIKAIRQALGISLRQLASKLSITRQSALALEQREMEGSITLKSLRQAGRALDMKLVYGFVPNDGSFEKLIDRKAQELAEQIVNRTAQSMQLENQANSRDRIKRAVEERKELLKREMPKMLWD